MARLALLAALGTLLLSGCLLGGGDEEPTPTPVATQVNGAEVETPQPTQAQSTPTPVSTTRPTRTPRSTRAPTGEPGTTPTPDQTDVPTPDVTDTPTPGPTPTNVAQNMDVARDLVWVYLGRCITLDRDQLKAYQVQEDWIVRASGDDSGQQYGFWVVDAATGALDPQDPLARELVSHIESQCSRESIPVAFLSAPIPTPLPTPEATAEPTATPVVESEDVARNLDSLVKTRFEEAPAI